MGRIEVMTHHARTFGVACTILAALWAAVPAVAAQRPRSTEAIVQFDAGVRPAQQRATVRAAGGAVVRDLHVIRALGVRLAPGGAARLRRSAGVRAVTPNASMRPDANAPRAPVDSKSLSTDFIQSTRADKAWLDPRNGSTGQGVAVGVIDTGIAGELPDFRTSATD